MTRAAGMLGAALLVLAPACGDGAAAPTTTAPVTTATTTTTTSPAPTATTEAPPAATTSSATTAPTITVTPTKTVPVRRYYFPIELPADYGPDHHDYPATDIFAPVGATVVAVTGGVVDELGRVDVWDPAVNDPATRGGLFFSLIGDDGVRYYYSHFDELAAGITAGDRVEAGQEIGTVGNSGNARDTPSHIHFGLSPPTFPGDWEVRRGVVPPYEYLQQWEDGVDVAPVLPAG